MESRSKAAATTLPGAATSRRRPAGIRARLAVAVAAGLALACGAWLVLRDGDGDSKPDGPVSSAVSVAQLRALPSRTGHPVYWAGPRARNTYELTRPTDGNVYIRYLPPGVAVGDRRPAFTTIGTYPQAGALKAVRKLSRQPGVVTFRVAGDGIAVYSRTRPRSVYLAFPGKELQVEIYDPSPPAARRLARSGVVRPIR
jgi:hypothetical protein